MKKLLTILAAAALSLVLRGEDSLLLWQFSEWTEVEGDYVETMIADVNGGPAKPISELEGRGEAKGKKVNGARVRMVGDSVDEYLNFYAAIDTGFGYTPVGAANSSVINLPSYWHEGGVDYPIYDAGPAFALIGDISTLPANVSFMIELGNYEDGNWWVLATSQEGTLAELTDNGYIFNSELNMQSVVPWTGGQYGVPEPTSGILILIGGGLLALRRGKARK